MGVGSGDGPGRGGGETKPRNKSNPLTLEKMSIRLKERNGFPKNTQGVLAEPELESHFPASLCTAL